MSCVGRDVENSKLFKRYLLFLEPSAEKKLFIERAKVDHCEASLIVRKQARHGE
jgi:hypothetical protein